MIVLMAGLPGTGKSTLARELAKRTGGRVIGKDEIRHSLFSENEIKYSSRQDDFCLQIMLQLAAYVLQRNPQRIVFLDGRPFSRRYQIDNVAQAASSIHQTWRILECVCPEDVARKRLKGETDHPATNRNFQLYLEVQSRFEAITLPKMTIDTSETLEVCIDSAMIALGGT
jgi:predicted kinase